MKLRIIINLPDADNLTMSQVMAIRNALSENAFLGLGRCVVMAGVHTHELVKSVTGPQGHGLQASVPYAEFTWERGDVRELDQQ